MSQELKGLERVEALCLEIKDAVANKMLKMPLALRPMKGAHQMSIPCQQYMGNIVLVRLDVYDEQCQLRIMLGDGTVINQTNYYFEELEP